MTQTVKMYRQAPLYPGGPVEADVHPSNVEEMQGFGWFSVPKRGKPRAKRENGQKPLIGDADDQTAGEGPKQGEL